MRARIRRTGSLGAVALVAAIPRAWDGPARAARVTREIVTVAEPTSGIDPHYAEPHFATNPRDASQIVVASIGVHADGGWRVHAFVTSDGGLSWQEATLPPLDGLRCFADPWVVWGEGETAYLACLTRRPVPGEEDWDAAVLFYRTDDAGANWRPPLMVPDDDARGSWDHPVARLSTGGDVVVAGTRSRIGGHGFGIARYRPAEHRFQPLRRYEPPEQVNDNFGGAATVPDDGLVFTYFTMRGEGPRPLYAVRMTPDGEERTLVREHVTPWGFPMLAASRGSSPEAVRLYAVWLEAGTGRGLDVLISRSDGEARSWSRPLRVNAPDIGAWRAVPQVAAGAAGTVAVAWYDARHAASPGEPQPCGDIYVRRLRPDGTPDGPEIRITRNGRCPKSADPRGVRSRWRAGGDYLGLEVRDPNSVALVWAEPGPNGSRIRFARVRLP